MNNKNWGTPVYKKLLAKCLIHWLFLFLRSSFKPKICAYLSRNFHIQIRLQKFGHLYKHP